MTTWTVCCEATETPIPRTTTLFDETHLKEFRRVKKRVLSERDKILAASNVTHFEFYSQGVAFLKEASTVAYTKRFLVAFQHRPQHSHIIDERVRQKPSGI